MPIHAADVNEPAILFKKAYTPKARNTDITPLSIVPQRFFFSDKRTFLIPMYTKYGTTPTRILGTNAIKILLNIPDVPANDAASTGENTKDDKDVPAIVDFKQLVNPKTNPRKAPFFGPQKSDPRITGM